MCVCIFIDTFYSVHEKCIESFSGVDLKENFISLLT